MAISLYPEYRGQGLGAKLTKALLKLLQTKGYPRVSLSVQQANHHAIEMYQNVGFITVSETPEEYLMVYDLQN